MKIYDYHGRANICGARMQVAGIDIDQRTISRIELEKRFLADFEMREIARILQISLDELAER